MKSAATITAPTTQAEAPDIELGQDPQPQQTREYHLEGRILSLIKQRDALKAENEELKKKLGAS